MKEVVTVTPIPPDDGLENYDIAEAAHLVEQIPAEWLAAAAGELPVEKAIPEGSDPDVAARRKEFAPLDRAARARIAEHVVTGYLQANPPPAARGWFRRWWVSLPLTAATASLLTLWSVGAVSRLVVLSRHRSIADEPLVGSVHVARAERGADGPGPESALRLAWRDYFDLDCRVEGRALEVVRVRATRVADAGPPQSYWLGGVPLAERPDGATLHLRADPPPGTWQLTCDVYDRDMGRLISLEPPARLVIE